MQPRTVNIDIAISGATPEEERALRQYIDLAFRAFAGAVGGDFESRVVDAETGEPIEESATATA